MRARPARVQMLASLRLAKAHRRRHAHAVTLACLLLLPGLQGKLVSLRRVKDDVKEVAAGTECGIAVEGFKEWEVRGPSAGRRGAGLAPP